MPKHNKKKNNFIIGLSTTVLGAAVLTAGPSAHAAEDNVVDTINENKVIEDVAGENYFEPREISTSEQAASENQEQIETVDENSRSSINEVEKMNSETDSNQLESSDNTSSEEALENIQPSETEDIASAEEEVEDSRLEDTEIAGERQSSETIEEPVGADSASSTEAIQTDVDTTTDNVDSKEDPVEKTTEQTAQDEIELKEISEEPAGPATTDLNEKVDIESDSQQETLAEDEPQKDPQAGDAPLGEDGSSTTESAIDPAETEAGAEVLAEENLEISEEKKPQAQQAGEGEETTEPNYAEDEAKIKDYNDKERYRPTQMEQGNGTAASFIPPDEKNNFIDGYRYHSSEPSKASEDKTQWGVEMEFDKEKSQRTYTDFQFTNAGNLGGVLDPGNVSANEAGEKIAGGEKDPNYKATSEIEITASRTQRNLNLYASEEDLKHINNKDNTNTIMAWQGKYKKDHYVEPNATEPNATEGKSATFSFTVNPWPNENDKLSLIKLNGSHDKGEFVQGQTITTGVRVENLDDNARERLVGQVYHPETGEVVKGAKAYIDENDNVVVKMPDGVLMKDANGKTVINEDSIFYKDDKYKGIQNLEVKFFARPRTKDEFEAIAGEKYGTYTETGAGEETIKHKGQDITIDKQGIDRYDHYNLIGGFELKLDDESNYDIITKDITADKIVTDKMLRLKAGVDKKVEQVDNPNSDAPHKYITSKADNAVDSYLEPEYKDFLIPVEGEKNKYRTEDNWLVEVDPENPQNIKVSTPIGAKKGENLTLPVTHLFTNGSEKNFLINYVVSEESIEKPDYKVAVTEAGEEVTNTPTNNHTESKPKPVKYELESTSIVDDNGKTWTLSIDEETGVITAKAPGEIDKVSTINAPVIATYVDQNLNNINGNDLVYTERSSATFSATAPQKGEVKFTQDNTIEFETKVQYNPDKDPTESGVVQKGKNGKYTADYTVTYKDGEVVEGPTIVEGTERDREEPTPQIFEIGTKGASVDVNAPDEQTIEIPFTTEIITDENQPVGYRKETPGENGEKKISYEVVQENGNATVKATETTTKEMIPRRIVVGTMPSELDVDFNPEIDVKVDNTKDVGSVDTEIVQGEYKTVTKNVQNPDGSIDTIEEVVEITKPKQIITVGTKDYTGDVSHTTTEEIPFDADFVENPELKAGTTRVTKEGVAGSREVTYTIPVRNGELDETDGKKITSTSKQTKAAENEIIEVGTKPVEKVVTIPFTTEYKYDPNLKAGEREVDVKGEDGYRKLVTTYDKDKKQAVTKVEEEKAAVNSVIKIGGKTNGTETIKEAIPFEVEIKPDPSLKAGEYKYETDANGNEKKGVAGVQEITYTIVNSKVTNTSQPNITKQAENAVILVGNEDFEGTVSHEVTEAIPFKVEFRENSSLPVGTTRVITEGKEGSKTTEYSIEVVNGAQKPDTTVNATEKSKTDAVNEVIEIGTKPVDPVEKDVSSEVGVVVEIENDPELDLGKTRIGELKPGKVENVVTTVYNPATGKMETREDKKVTPAKQIVYVGTKDLEGTQEFVVTQPVPFETEYVEDSSLEAGKTEIKQQGQTGEKTVTYKAEAKNGEVTSHKATEEITKEPVKQIIRVGTKSEETNTEVVKENIPFEIEYEYTDELEAGKIEVKQEGELGEKTTTTTTTIVNGVESIDKKEEPTKEPVKRIVRVGTKIDRQTTDVTGSETTTIPYKTTVIYDPDLKAGEQVVDTKGENGERKITVTVPVKDGVAGDPVVKTEDIKKAVDEVIRVGTRDDSSNYVSNTNVITESIPFETRYEEDSNLPVGETRVETPGEFGSKTTTTSTIIVDGESKTSTDEKVTKKPVVQVVKVGTKLAEIPAQNLEESKTEDIPYTTIIQYNDKMDVGSSHVVQEGENGETTITTKVSVENGVAKNPEITTSTTKEAKPRIIQVGTRELKKEVKSEVAYETEVIFDDTLPAGEKRVESGVVGEKTTTITHTLKDDQIVTNKEEKVTKEAKNEIVRVGTKTAPVDTKDVTKTIEVDLAYGTEIIYDDTMPSGTEKVEQNGEVGKREIIVTVPVKDGIAGEARISKDEVIKEAKPRIIRVGTLCKAPEVPEEPEKPADKDIVSTTKVEIPFETEIIEDDTIEAGKLVEEQAGVNGERTITSTVTITDGETGTPVITTKITKQPVKRIVRVGTKKTPGTNTPEKTTSIEKLPFDTIYINDNTLPEGTQIIEQPGQEGEKIITIIGDSVIEDITVKPRPRIIRVGTKKIGDRPTIVPRPEPTPNPSNGETDNQSPTPLVPSNPSVEETNDDYKESKDNIDEETEIEDIKEDDIEKAPSNTDDKIDINPSDESINSEKEDIESSDTDIANTKENRKSSDDDIANTKEKRESSDDDIANTKEKRYSEDQAIDGVKVPNSVEKIDSEKITKSTTNPKTGIAGSEKVGATLAASLFGLFASKKKKEDEEE